MSGSKEFGAAFDYPPVSEPSGKNILYFDPLLPTTFLQLLDTFNSYVGEKGKSLIVSESEEGITLSAGIIESDKHAVHVQVAPSADFSINHKLKKFPSVQAFTAAGNPAEVHYSHTDNNNIRIQSEIDFNGVIYMN